MLYCSTHYLPKIFPIKIMNLKDVIRTPFMPCQISGVHFHPHPVSCRSAEISAHKFITGFGGYGIYPIPQFRIRVYYVSNNFYIFQKRPCLSASKAVNLISGHLFSYQIKSYTGILGFPKKPNSV